MGQDTITTGEMFVWLLYSPNDRYASNFYFPHIIRPVINLKSNVQATGSGTSSDPYVIQ